MWLYKCLKRSKTYHISRNIEIMLSCGRKIVPAYYPYTVIAYQRLCKFEYQFAVIKTIDTLLIIYVGK